MTNEDDFIIRAAARIICAGYGRKRESVFKPEQYISGNGDDTVWMRLVERGIRKGIEIGKSL